MPLPVLVLEKQVARRGARVLTQHRPQGLDERALAVAPAAVEERQQVLGRERRQRVADQPLEVERELQVVAHRRRDERLPRRRLRLVVPFDVGDLRDAVARVVRAEFGGAEVDSAVRDVEQPRVAIEVLHADHEARLEELRRRLDAARVLALLVPLQHLLLMLDLRLHILVLLPGEEGLAVFVLELAQAPKRSVVLEPRGQHHRVLDARAGAGAVPPLAVPRDPRLPLDDEEVSAAVLGDDGVSVRAVGRARGFALELLGTGDVLVIVPVGAFELTVVHDATAGVSTPIRNARPASVRHQDRLGLDQSR